MFKYTFKWLTRPENEEKLRNAIGEDFDFATLDRNGENILNGAVGNRNYKLTDWLIANGFDVNRTNKDGTSPIEHAALNSDTVSLQKLVEAKTFRMRNEDNALHYCAMYGPTDNFVLLVNAGYRLDDVKHERMPIHWAIQQHQTEIVDYCLAHMTNGQLTKANDIENLLNCAVGEVNPRIKSTKECLMLLLGNKTVSRTLKQDSMPLPLAVSEKSFFATEQLLVHGADPNYTDDGLSVLFIATMRKQPRIAKLLIRYGADTNFISPDNISIADLQNEQIRKQCFIQWFYPSDEPSENITVTD